MAVSNNRNRRRGAKRALLVFMLILCLAGALMLGALGIGERMERRKGDDFYADLAAQGGQGAVAAPAGQGGQATSAAPQAASIAPGASPAPSSAPASQAARGERPTASASPTASTASDAPTASAAPTASSPADGAARPQSAMDFDAIRAACPDVVGWLRLEDSVIDYPIVQGEDNDFYLGHLADGTPNEAGSIMLDKANDGGFADEVSILHGHHMRSGSMFGDLAAYKDEEYYLTHPVIRLYTPGGDYAAEVFAACTVNGYTFGYPTSFKEEEDFERFVSKAVSKTPYETGVEVRPGDRILLLSTCEYSFEGARYVVMARLPAAP